MRGYPIFIRDKIQMRGERRRAMEQDIIEGIVIVVVVVVSLASILAVFVFGR